MAGRGANQLVVDGAQAGTVKFAGMTKETRFGHEKEMLLQSRAGIVQNSANKESTVH